MSVADKDHEGLLSRLQSNLNDFYKLHATRNTPTVFDDPEPFTFSDWIPTVDIKENRRRFLIKTDVPGIDPKNINVSMENGCLSIAGERKTERETADESHRLKECSYGAFERRFRLPDTADGSKVSAKCRDGVLSVTIPKRKVKKAKPIAIE